MSDGIMLSIGEDGIAREYDDTYDITIHCESREEQEEAIKCLGNKPHWILCSDRLPEEETDVIVTRTFLGLKDRSHGWNNHLPPKTYVEVAQYFNGEWRALSDEYKCARDRHTDPIAWMPLPEPYQEDEE
jgi:hypothetical protein